MCTETIKTCRPPFEDIKSGGGFILCSCGQCLSTVQQTREHWQFGHFDYLDTEKSVDMFKDVLSFHKKYHLPISKRPGWVRNDIQEFRMNFIREEFQELEDAYAIQDLSEFFDGLLDLVYVCIGMAVFMNLPWNEGWRRVQDANMKKVRVESGGPRHGEYDIVKPEGWKPPVFDDLFEEDTLP